jgi:hypothetical protein
VPCTHASCGRSDQCEKHRLDTSSLTLNNWQPLIRQATPDKMVGCLRAADDFLRERAGTAKPKDMLKYLRCAPKVAPNA